MGHLPSKTLLANLRHYPNYGEISQHVFERLGSESAK